MKIVIPLSFPFSPSTAAFWWITFLAMRGKARKCRQDNKNCNPNKRRQSHWCESAQNQVSLLYVGFWISTALRNRSLFSFTTNIDNMLARTRSKSLRRCFTHSFHQRFPSSTYLSDMVCLLPTCPNQQSYLPWTDYFSSWSNKFESWLGCLFIMVEWWPWIKLANTVYFPI